jgi:hypothetical protein
LGEAGEGGSQPRCVLCRLQGLLGLLGLLGWLFCANLGRVKIGDLADEVLIGGEERVFVGEDSSCFWSLGKVQTKPAKGRIIRGPS